MPVRRVSVSRKPCCPLLIVEDWLIVKAALLSTSEIRHAHVVTYLLEKGAEVNRASTESSIPAQEAAAQGHTEILKTLIAYGADLSLRNAEGENVLEVAMSRGQGHIVTILLDSLGSPDYPLESLSLLIMGAKHHKTMRSLLNSTSLMYADGITNNTSADTPGWTRH